MMHTEIRKLHLIEEVLKVDNEQILSALEAVLRNTVSVKISSENPLLALSGIWSENEAQQIEDSITENFEQIYHDDWE